MRAATATGHRRGAHADLRIWCAAVFAIALTASLARAVAVPLFGSADEIGHFDYAYQVWHGRLPDFYQGTVVDQVKGQTIPVQWVSQHPPLFYAVMAPVIGPLTDAHHVLIAGMLARGVNSVFGALVPVVIVWGLIQAFPRARRLAVTAGLVAATSPWLHGVSGAVYNDAFTALLSALAIALTCRMLRRGQGRADWAWLALVSAAAACTRLSMVPIVAVCLAALTLDGLARGSGHGRGRRWTALAMSVGTAALMAATSGWFYLRNVRLTGSVTGGHPEWSAEHLGRVETSLGELALSAGTWEKLLGIFQTAHSGYTAPFVGLVLAPVVVGLVGLVAVLPAHRPDGGTVAVTALMAVLTAAVLAMQLKYAAGGGGLIPRYSLPVLLPVAAVIAWGLVWSPALSRVLVPLWTLGVGAVLVQWTLAVRPSDPSQFPTFPVVTYAGMALCLVLVALTAIGIARMPRR